MTSLSRWINRTLVAAIALAGLLAAAVFARATMVRGHVWDVPATPVVVPTSAAIAVREGERLARVLGCYGGCHGTRLEGALFFSERGVADLVAPNLSQVVPSYSDAELARAIRHGVRRDGTGLFAMPSPSFFHLTDEDLGRLIAFLRRQPREAGETRATSIGPLGHIGIATGKFQPVPATMDHRATRVGQVPPAGGMARGQYLAHIACTECHGRAFEGGLDGRAPPLAVAIAYTDETFRHLLRTGETPGKRDLYLMDDAARSRFVHFTDEEIADLLTFLRST